MRNSRAAYIIGALFVMLVAVLLCLVPKPENDLFFILRIGGDMVHAHRLPHADTYSWTNYGTRWDVPEWGAFALYAIAYQCGGFFGTWLVLAFLTASATLLLFVWLSRWVGAWGATAFTLLAVLAAGNSLQERPYAFTYPLLVLGLILLMRERRRYPCALLWLPPLCAVWTNLHQGVVAFVLLLVAFALGDGLMALRRPFHARRARLTLATAAGCALAALLSPYGGHVYGNVLLTLRDPTLMSGVTEWNPITVLPPAQWLPFALLAVLVFAAYAASPRRNLSDGLALLALFAEALLHARNMALFAFGGSVIAAPYLRRLVRRLRRIPFASPPALRLALVGVFAVLYVFIFALVTLINLRRDAGVRGLSPEGIGEAVARVPRYPGDACAFLTMERFPPGLRLLNDFETGGFLMWRCPGRRVFVDGRLDVFAGRTFRDAVALSRDPGSPAWRIIANRYDFDCVLTVNPRVAQAFAADAREWQLVYEDAPRPHHPRAYILVRRRPRFASLIARCLHDRPP